MTTRYSDPHYSNLDLSDSIGQLGSFLSAVLSELLVQVAELEQREAYRDDGAFSMESWLCTRLGLSYATAQEYVRVARALTSLPRCAQALAEGRFSWDQIRALTRFARPEEDEALAAQATGKSAAALEWAARRARRISREEAQDEHDRRGLRWWPPHDGGFRLSARLPAADGAVVAAALERLSDHMPAERPDHDGVFEPAAARYADALVALASSRLAEDSDADRACVVLHVDASALAGGDGGAQLEEGTAVSPDVARRLACDGRLELVAEGERGPIGVGRARRTIPAWLMRLLRRRDGVCQFPGCRRRRLLQGHHVKHWLDDGPTNLDNLLLTCRPHHKLKLLCQVLCGIDPGTRPCGVFGAAGSERASRARRSIALRRSSDSASAAARSSRASDTRSWSPSSLASSHC